MKNLFKFLALFMILWPALAAHAAAPVISNLTIITNGPPVATPPSTILWDSITVYWTTDIPATSQVNYGVGTLTNKQTTYDPTLVTTHQVTIGFLDQYQTYSYQASSTDGGTGTSLSLIQNILTCQTTGGNFTALSGAINNYYEYGLYTINWVNGSGLAQAPSICGQSFGMNFSGNLDRGSSFSLPLADTQQIVPSQSFYNIAITGIDGSIGAFNINFPATSVATNISTQLATAANNQLIHVWYDPATQVFYPPLSGGVTLGGDVTGPANANHVGGLHFGSTAFTLSTTQPPTPSLPVLGYIAPGILGGIAGGGGGGGGCAEDQCVQNNPVSTQIVTQPDGTSLYANYMSGDIWADQFGTGINGIQTAYTKCLAQNGVGPSGCSIFVSPLYTNLDVPSGWQYNSAVGYNAPAQVPPGGAIYDERNGTMYKIFRDPLNPVTGQGTGDATITNFDIDTAHSNAVVAGPNRAGRMNVVNVANGGVEFFYYPGGMPDYTIETYTYGQHTVMSDWIGGIDFGSYNEFNKYSNGDFVGDWMLQRCAGGILSANSEGCEHADWGTTQLNTVYTGTITGTPATGATSVHASPTIGAGTQGAMYRWLVNQSTPLFTGGALTGVIPERSTGSGNSATMPPAIIDSTQTFPVSTMAQICYPGSDNGASGAAGCTSGSQPVGYIPSQNYRLTLTACSVTSGVASCTMAPTAPQTKPLQLVANQPMLLYGFSATGAGAFMNGQSTTASATGLTSTTVQFNITGPDTASTGGGSSTYSPNGYSPSQAVAVGFVPSYTTGGGTGGLPAGFCAASAIQTSNSGAACYVPATGVGCIADQTEIEPVNFTYSGSTLTITNMQFPHLNGAIFAYGTLACKLIEDVGSQYTAGGTSGIMDEVYPTVGALDSHTVYYVPQRTNLGYASPPLGGSTDGSSFNGGVNANQVSTLCFSTSMGNFAVNSGVVTFNMGGVAGTSGNPYSGYNKLAVTIAANGDASYNGTYAITSSGGTGFSYTPSAPTGTHPTSGTVSYCSAGYKILDGARVASVLNPSNNALDNTFVLFPNTASLSGATVREPHYQQMEVNGTHSTVTQFLPKPFLGSNPDTFTYSGNVSGAAWGVTISNTVDGSMYLGGGGTEQPPSEALGLFGVWNDMIVTSGPQETVLRVGGFNLAGPSSALSTFGLIQLPPLPSAFAGYSLDTLCYNPAYNLANRGMALTTGEFIFGNVAGYQCNNGPANGSLVSAVRMGHLIADLDASAPEITSNDVTVNALPNFLQNSPGTVGTTGGSCYNYQIVAHDKNNGSTVPPGAIGGSPCSINNGNASLNTSNFNRICAFVNPGVFSYDFLKQVGSVYQSMAINVAINNGASHGSVPNYTCWDDQGGATSAYNYPTQNTTGSIAANSVFASIMNASTAVTAPSVFATNLTPGNCVQAAAGGLLVTTSTPCGSGGGGGGMVYPPPGVGVSNGAAWLASLTVGTGANNLMQLDGSGNAPAVSAVNMSGYLYANLAGSGIVPKANGGTGTATPALVAGTNVTITGTWPNQTINASTGSSGFPITLGSTSIAASSTTTSIAGLTVNGVLLNSAGSTTLFLNQAGAYSSVAVVSSFAAPSGSWPAWLVPTVTNSTSTPSLAVAASTIPVSAGGTGVTSAALIAGTGITITGTWPNQTINATGGGSGISGQTAACVGLAGSASTFTSTSHLCETGGQDVFTQPVFINGAAGNGLLGLEAAAPGGVANQDAMYPDSTQHRWAMINDNLGAVNVAFSAVETVAFSTTPTININVSMSVVATMTANITSFTMAAGDGGDGHTLCFIQGSGSYTVAAPGNVKGLSSIGNSSGKMNCQHFAYYPALTSWYADAGMQTNM